MDGDSDLSPRGRDVQRPLSEVVQSTYGTRCCVRPEYKEFTQHREHFTLENSDTNCTYISQCGNSSIVNNDILVHTERVRGVFMDPFTCWTFTITFNSLVHFI